jgi:hypothetical protein
MEDPRPVALDEKAIQHHESSHSHQEVVGSDHSNEAELHESEKDVPVSNFLRFSWIIGV